MSVKFEGKPPFYLGIAEVASGHARDGSVQGHLALISTASRRITFLASRRTHSAVADFVGSMLQSGHSVWRQPSIY
jgi:hypothetical protein